MPRQWALIVGHQGDSGCNVLAEVDCAQMRQELPRHELCRYPRGRCAAAGRELPLILASTKWMFASSRESHQVRVRVHQYAAVLVAACLRTRIGMSSRAPERTCV